MAVLTRRITRDKLALFLKDANGRPSHELIKAFENLTEDTIQTGEALPIEIANLRGLIEEESLNSGAGRADAMAALTIAIAVQNLADVLASAPVQQPDLLHAGHGDFLCTAPMFHSSDGLSCGCDTSSRLESLSEEVAALRSQLQALQITPI